MEESKSVGSVLEYMQRAVDQARKGLEANEVPVGCVFVHQPTGKVLAESHNLTNQTKNVRNAKLTR